VRTIVVTGATNGIGRAAAVELARGGARVVLVARDPVRAAEVAAQIAEFTADADRAIFIRCDLASFADVRDAAAEITERAGPIDGLVNNAGLIGQSRQLTADGNELTFQVNHLSHFLLTNLLRPALVSSGAATVVNVSSDAHLSWWRGIRFDDLTLAKGWTPFGAYSMSKLANIMFTYELARRWDADPVTAVAMHPGVASTNFGRTGWGTIGRLWDVFVPKRTAEQAADTAIWLAAAPPSQLLSGGYYFRRRLKRSSPVSYDRDAQVRLWEVSARLTGLSAEELR
jgi:NAD(P)-dependent dehydrogenase (short-subunit alcohol dehydrogenase family)